MSYIAHKAEFNHPLAKWAFSLIQSLEGKTFVVYFKKRTGDKSTRRMVASWLPSMISERGWNPFEKNLLNVFDIEKGDYRFVSMDSVEKIIIGGETFVFLPEEKEEELEQDYHSFLVSQREQSFADLKNEMHALFC